MPQRTCLPNACKKKPSFPTSDGDSSVPLKDRFQFFCRHGHGREEVTGTEAVDAKFTEVNAKYEQGAVQFKVAV